MSAKKSLQSYSSIFFYCVINNRGSGRGVVDRVPAFQPRGPGSIPCRVRDFILHPGTVSSVVSGGGSDILLSIDSGWRSALVLLSSVLVHSLAPPTLC